MNRGFMRYIAVLSDDPGTLADFYARHFDLEELGRSNQGDVSLTDGFYNLTFLKRRNELMELHLDTGLHHVGLQVPSIEAALIAYGKLCTGGVSAKEAGGIHFGDVRIFDPEMNPVSLTEGDFGVGERRKRAPRVAHVAFNALVPQNLYDFYNRICGFREVTTGRKFRENHRRNRFAGDGVTNLAIHPFYNDTVGHEARFGVNHFGFRVDDIDRRLDALSKEIPVAPRPESRPFAEFRLFDPEGNKFDLSQNKGWEVDVDIWDQAAA